MCTNSDRFYAAVGGGKFFLRKERTGEFTFSGARDQIMEHYSRVLLPKELKRVKGGWMESESGDERNKNSENFSA